MNKYKHLKEKLENKNYNTREIFITQLDLTLNNKEITVDEYNDLIIRLDVIDALRNFKKESEK